MFSGVNQSRCPVRLKRTRCRPSVRSGFLRWEAPVPFPGSSERRFVRPDEDDPAEADFANADAAGDMVKRLNQSANFIRMGGCKKTTMTSRQHNAEFKSYGTIM